jgi:hypothetical protein
MKLIGRVTCMGEARNRNKISIEKLKNKFAAGDEE